ncbi:sensor histidine kinase [Fusobacterium nucleatum subsp. nucleatum ATCC 25586]|uniref:histidine kinase n=1 Tax=Fusobacterium nucleatum subsp. nucleatum (strain ATCC 25586 / DSM 15643 / BCRC 10681 / CIP 101130 / JCM 8532 / KCTC 2640 / LMG 13131 / VPI 4355) TaxID=190304 RepID=Q8R5N6_FUSNN|nr:Sensory Transduction Protein Kinase [Fusobacterium nucleatum subsp. nucleatum ATCC 25586]AVQ16013.1 sensor histidine kinase [Fusobacterium nucleatum subsp. nucleatum ATCC 25586]
MLKTYYWVIVLFAIFSIFIIVNFSVYLWKENQNDIKVIEEFIEYQMEELKNREDLDYLSKEWVLKKVLDKAPKIRDVYLEIFYNDKKYAKSPYLPDKAHNFLDYYSVTKVYQIEGFDDIKVKITRRNVRDRLLILNAFTSFVFFLLFCLYVIIRIQKKFFDKFKNSLDNLKIFTQDYNLDSEIRIHNEENFIEFSILQKSFKNMLLRLKEQSQLQIDFVNNASHELKTPIFVIKGYVNMLNDWGKDDKEVLDESLIVLKKEIQNMQELTEKLLFLAKSRNLIVEKTNINLDNVLKEVIDNLSFAYPKQKINYNSSEIFIDSDIGLLKLLFKNLIENAIKYGNDNPINIELKKEKKIKVIIEDFGIGISKEAIPHIFERFYREDEARNREIKSYGLGLSIVKEIVALLNIDIQIESQINKGTKITLLF